MPDLGFAVRALRGRNYRLYFAGQGILPQIALGMQHATALSEPPEMWRPGAHSRGPRELPLAAGGQ